PGRDAFLVQSFDQSRAAIRPDDLLICDFDGSALGGPAGVRPPSEVYLHAEILRVRHDVHAVAHFHHDPSIVFTLVDRIPLGAVRPLTADEIARFLRGFDRDRHVAKLWKYYVARGRARGLLPAARTVSH